MPVSGELIRAMNYVEDITTTLAPHLYLHSQHEHRGTPASGGVSARCRRRDQCRDHWISKRLARSGCR